MQMKDKIGAKLKWAAGRLAKNSIETSALDAEVLLAHTLGAERITIHIDRDRTLTGAELVKFEDAVARRCAKEPVAYITGVKEFWSIPIKVTRDVLIPRPETEGIVEHALAVYQGTAVDALDLCTGSGCIAAALATELPDARIAVADISAAAVEVARINLAFAGGRITYLTGDLFSAIPLLCKEGTGEEPLFDLITANPPYVSEDELEGLDECIRLYEPGEALLAGTDGLAISKRIIQDAPRYLKRDGTLIMEMGAGQAPALWEFANETERYGSIRIFEDLSGIERYLVLGLRSQV